MTRPCGCPEDYHLADCPHRTGWSEPDPYDGDACGALACGLQADGSCRRTLGCAVGE